MECQFFGTWKVRAANWNTGRLYFGDNYGFGVSSFGPVCQGTGAESITGSNADRFGKLACVEMGFSDTSFLFIGLRNNYEKFMGFTLPDDKMCIPEYKAAGAICGTNASKMKQVK